MPQEIKLIPYNFDDIRNDLKAKAKSFHEGDDFDTTFEGSNLARLIDIIAYDSHTQNINHQAQLRENFITTATTRANVIRAAKRMGYIPQRTLSFIYKLDVQLPISSHFILKQGTKFTQGDNIYTYLGVDKSIDTRKTVRLTQAALEHAHASQIELKFNTINGIKQFTCLAKSNNEFFVPDEAQVTPVLAQVTTSTGLLGSIKTASVIDGEVRLKLDTVNQTAHVTTFTKVDYPTKLVQENGIISFNEDCDKKIRNIQQITENGVPILTNLELRAITLNTTMKNISLNVDNVPSEDIYDDNSKILQNNKDLHIELSKTPLTTKDINVVLETTSGVINTKGYHVANNNIEVQDLVQVKELMISAGISTSDIMNLDEVVSVKSNAQNIYDFDVVAGDAVNSSKIDFAENLTNVTVIYTTYLQKEDVKNVKINYRTALDSIDGKDVVVTYTTDILYDDLPDVKVTIRGEDYDIKSFKNDLLVVPYTGETFNMYDDVLVQDKDGNMQSVQFSDNDIHSFEVKEGVLQEHQEFTINYNHVKSNSFIFEAQSLEQEGLLLSRGETVLTERKTLLSTSRDFNTFVVQETEFKDFYEVKTRLAGTGTYLLQGQQFVLRALKSKGSAGELKGELIPSDARIKVLKVEQAQRGKDSETTEEIRINAQVIRETALRAVTAQDYITLLETRPNVVHAQVVGSEELSNQGGEVFIYIVPDTLSTELTTSDGRVFKTKPSVQLTESEKLKVKQFLLYKKVITMKNTVKDVQYVDFSLDIRVRDTRVLTDEHRLQTVKIAQDYFKNVMRFNSGYRNSELISLIQDELTDDAAITIDFKMTGVAVDSELGDDPSGTGAQIPLGGTLSLAYVEHGTQTSTDVISAVETVENIHAKFRRARLDLGTFELKIDKTNTESIDFIHNVYPRLAKIEFN